MTQTRFFINAYEIDLSRSVVILDSQQTHVEPKVLQVLLLLAQRQREHGEQVVTHQEIMSQVWQGAEVVPNALQRCIAILRKVLGDDAKNPTIIATHPKIGYRLIAPVRWPEPSIEPATRITNNPYFKASTLVVSTLLLFSLLYLLWPDNRRPEYTRLTPVTHTDAHESHVIFSPDGDYLIFNRYAGSCSNHLWARHISSHKEYQLSHTPGQFGAASFTPDGRELVFAAKADCNLERDKVDTQPCWTLASLDFAQALGQPQSIKSRYLCNHTQPHFPRALPNHVYAFLQHEAGQSQVVQYNDLTKSINTLFSTKNEHLYHFDYHAPSQRFALLSQDKQLNHILRIVDKEAQILHRNQITLLPHMDPNTYLPGRFTPDGNTLLAVSNGQLYTLSLGGKVSKISTPASHLLFADKHPIDHTLAAIHGGKDIDIAHLLLSNSPSADTAAGISHELNARALPYTSLSRTQAQERQAHFSPDGQHIAFVSNRNGTDQLWVWQSNKATALSDASVTHPIHGFVWSPDAKQLLWAQGGTLYISDLSGRQQSLSTTLPIHSVQTWGNQEHLLVLINDPVPGGLYLYDLVSNQLKKLGVNGVHRAWQANKQVYYSDALGKVKRFTLGENPAHATALSSLNGRAMVIKGGHIFSVDQSSLTLNQFDLNGTLIKPLRTLKPTAWKISDVHQDQLLLEQFIGIDQELILIE
ncbi:MULTISPECIES: winged helix-turn-helix domain-containing protein [unclassified Pseudoalteromonas]|uniref:winged helix-turn-helix domain-containing protein n=1 Tax=unclassified Pseudoalteromonas TaxID=194690 RepID=UPI0020970B56|nr:winged helix-turn-helix domain-containing protein [Pseudoalteromonas sp. XMcav2-N]MCO7189287.1 winged helix-turn-helix domain-containing protein [Pseudoalteromonas sp. XMcav2-N]